MKRFATAKHAMLCLLKYRDEKGRITKTTTATLAKDEGAHLEYDSNSIDAFNWADKLGVLIDVERIMESNLTAYEIQVLYEWAENDFEADSIFDGNPAHATTKRRWVRNASSKFENALKLNGYLGDGERAIEETWAAFFIPEK